MFKSVEHEILNAHKYIEHEILNAHKYKNLKKFGFLGSDKPRILGSDKPRMLFFRS